MYQKTISEVKNGSSLELLPLQKVMLDETREAFKRSKKIILQAGCGAGKTIIATQITKSARERGKTVLFIADRIVLCNQTSDVFLKYGIPHGVIQSQNPRFDLDQPVQVCSIQTLAMRGCNPADVIIIDECHVLHDAHKKIMEENPNSFILGLSASPYTKGLGKYFDFHIQPVPVKKLIEEKYLVPFDVYGPSIADLSKLKVQAGEYTEKSLSEVYDKADIIGDVVKTWQKITPGKKTIVFGVNVAHIKHLRDQFLNAGVSAVEINAYQTDEERETALDEFINRGATVLCSVEVATKGFDCPAVDVAVLAVATKSMIKWTQTTGRAFRTFQDKERAVILDLGGNCERLGFPDDYEFFGLDDGKKRKASEKKKERFPKACPSCDFIKPIGMKTCPACGFTPEFKKDVDVIDGELEKKQRRAKREYTISQKQEWLAQLNTYAAERNMKQGRNGCYGWALHAYKDKFGSWPAGKIDWSRRIPIGVEVRGYITYKNIAYANRRDREGGQQ
jgi:DNA repair protein RadD